MNIFKKLVGYSIGFRFNRVSPGIEANRSENKIYINLQKYRDLDYYDFLHEVYSLTDSSETDPFCATRAVISAAQRLDFFGIFKRLFCFLTFSSIFLSMQGAIFTILVFLCLCESFRLLRDLEKINIK